MTGSQARQIRELRMKGAGYRAIASVVGMSRDSVRNHCKAHFLDGFAAEVTLNIKEQMQQGKACLECGKTTTQPKTGRKRKFCSDACRREWWANHPDAMEKKKAAVYEKTCVYCGKVFSVYGNKTRKYCSHDCYVHDRFWRVEEGREPYKSPAQFLEVKHE